MKNLCSSFGLVLALMLLGGCAANVKKDANQAPLHVAKESSKAIALTIDGSKDSVEAKDWEAFKGEWRGAMKTATGKKGVSFVEQGNASSAQPGTLVSVYVNDYRYISPGARYGFGIMTGNAFVDSKVKFSDLTSGNVYGEHTYNTSSSAMQGIFSAMTEKQILAICEDIVTEIVAP